MFAAWQSLTVPSYSTLTVWSREVWTSFKTSSFVFHRRKTVLQVWNHMMLNLTELSFFWWTVPNKQKQMRLTLLMPTHSWKISIQQWPYTDMLQMAFIRDVGGSEVDLKLNQKMKRTCYKCQYQKRHVVKMQYVWKTLQMLHYNHCHQHLVFITEHISALSLWFWLNNIL